MSFDFDDFDVRSRFSDIDEKTDEIAAILRDLPDEEEDMKERCKIAYIYHDCALDGVVVTYPELRAAVDRKVMSDVALIPAYQQIKNHSAAIDHIDYLSEKSLRQSRNALDRIVKTPLAYELHTMLYRDLPRKTPGELRTDMPLHRTYFHNISEPEQIEGDLEIACGIVSDPDFRGQHAINQASLFHHKFMSVFPFAQGSGTVGRLLMNFFLVRSGYMPAVIHACDRQRYYEALRDGPESMRVLLLDSMEGALEATLRHLKDRFKMRYHSAQRMSMSG